MHGPLIHPPTSRSLASRSTFSTLLLSNSAVEESSLKNALGAAAGANGGAHLPADAKAQRTMLALRKQISSVLCAIAKVFLTDCFMEDNSLGHCDKLLDQALTYDPDNPEVQPCFTPQHYSLSSTATYCVYIHQGDSRQKTS